MSDTVSGLLTTTEVAAHLHLSEETVRRRKFDLGVVRIGNRFRFRPESVERFIRRQTEEQAVRSEFFE
jgi:excisionase family DNA binding protein